MRSAERTSRHSETGERARAPVRIPSTAVSAIPTSATVASAASIASAGVSLPIPTSSATTSMNWTAAPPAMIQP